MPLEDARSHLGPNTDRGCGGNRDALRAHPRQGRAGRHPRAQLEPRSAQIENRTVRAFDYLPGEELVLPRKLATKGEAGRE